MNSSNEALFEPKLFVFSYRTKKQTNKQANWEKLID
jgi:hypothetical protein